LNGIGQYNKSFEQWLVSDHGIMRELEKGQLGI